MSIIKERKEFANEKTHTIKMLQRKYYKNIKIVLLTAYADSFILTTVIKVKKEYKVSTRDITRVILCSLQIILQYRKVGIHTEVMKSITNL